MDIFSKSSDPSSAPQPQPQASSQSPLDTLRATLNQNSSAQPAQPTEPVQPAQQAAQSPQQPAQEAQPEEQPAVQPQQGRAPQQPSAEYQESQQYFPDYVKPIPEEEVYAWSAPSRPFKKHNRQYYTTVATIVLLISLILFFAGQFLPIAVVIAVGFLAYVLSSIPPHTITLSLTTYGIRVEEQLYYWDEIGRFWFSEKYGQHLVNFETARFPGRLTLVVTPEQKEVVREIVSEVLLEEKPPATQFERISAWLQEKIPLDIDR